MILANSGRTEGRTEAGKRLFVRPKPARIALLLALVVMAALAVRLFLKPGPCEEVCVVISGGTGTIRGLETAEYIYQWRLPGGGFQMLLVFSGWDWEAGPVGTLSFGAAHIAAMYGRVVCSDVTPQTEEHLSRFGLTYPVIYRSKDTYVSGRDLRSWFASEETPALEEMDCSMRRGRLVGGYPAPVITGTRSDGSVAFEWRWNGKHYEKMLGTVPVAASGVVVLFTYTGSGRAFPDEHFASDMNRAIVCAEGRALEATWWHRNAWRIPLVLENWELSDEDHWVRLPRGRIWFEIINDDCVCSYGK